MSEKRNYPFVKPNVMLYNNYVITDPIDTVRSEYIRKLQKAGYKIEVIKKENMKLSPFNPFSR